MTRKTFETWMAEFDALCAATYGFESADMPDIDYYELYESMRPMKRALAFAYREWEDM